LLDRVDNRRDPANGVEEASGKEGVRNEIVREDIEKARESAKNGDTAAATKHYRRAIQKAPDVIAAHLELAALYFERGDLRAAQSELEGAKRLEPKNALVRERLGDVYSRRGRNGLAIREWQIALNEDPSPGLLYKLKKALRENDETIDFEEVQRPHYVIRFDGRVNDTIGRVVASALDAEYLSLQQDFRFVPREPIEVTLYTNREFQDITRAPSWASALNDGEIRIPVEGVTEMTSGLRRVVRHELTHSFINAYTGGNCPAWFHEGLAQMREGSDRMDPYPKLRTAVAEGSILPLWSLEGLFVNYSKDKALLVYAESLAATEYLSVRRGANAPFEVLALLRRNLSMNEALRKVVGLDYQEFQTAWEADLERFHPRAH